MTTVHMSRKTKSYMEPLNHGTSQEPFKTLRARYHHAPRPILAGASAGSGIGVSCKFGGYVCISIVVYSLGGVWCIRR